MGDKSPKSQRRGEKQKNDAKQDASAKARAKQERQSHVEPLKK